MAGGSASPDDGAALIDQAVDPPNAGALRRDLAHIDLRRIVRAKHHRLDAGAHGIGRERGAGIAIGRHCDALDAKLLRHRYRHDEAARFERSSRQPTFVLDQHTRPRRVWNRNERRFDLAERDNVLSAPHRQDLAPAPHIRATRFERAFTERRRSSFQIIAHQKRTARFRQAVQHIRVIAFAGQRAFEMRDECWSVAGDVLEHETPYCSTENRSSLRPSTPHAIASPRCSAVTPAGEPVNTKSPGCKIQARESAAMMAGVFQII